MEREYVISAEESAEPGKYSFGRYAYLRDVVDWFADPDIEMERGAVLVGSPTAVDVSRGGKRLRRGARVRTVAAGLARLELFHCLQRDAGTTSRIRRRRSAHRWAMTRVRLAETGEKPR
jgi:hypothetical protein